MRTAPSDLATASLVAAIERGWGIRVLNLRYRPVGFGSHHWLAADGATWWWITVDDVASSSAPDAAVLADLRAAMQTARDLADAGCPFVVAPLPTAGGDPLVLVDDRYSVVVHPYVDGRAHEWGEVLDAEQRAAIVDVLASLHQVPTSAVPAARPDRCDRTGRFDHRGLLEGLPASPGRADLPVAGPYAAPELGN